MVVLELISRLGLVHGENRKTGVTVDKDTGVYILGHLINLINCPGLGGSTEPVQLKESIGFSDRQFFSLYSS